MLQGVPRNMTVGKSLKCLIPLFVKLFEPHENNIKIFMPAISK